MAVQPPQRFELDDLAHVEREARTIYAPGATPGDVLVVQSDHSLVAAPGGGSVPQPLVVLTLTAAELAARWSGDHSQSQMEVADINDTDVLLAMWELENTLDQNAALDTAMIYTPGAATDDVLTNGSSAMGNQLQWPFVSDFAFATEGDPLAGGIYRLVAGASAYVGILADAVPTTGQIAVVVWRVPGPA